MSKPDHLREVERELNAMLARIIIPPPAVSTKNRKPGTTLFRSGDGDRYRHYVAATIPTKTGKRRISFAYSVRRNLAGNFLIWREVAEFKGRRVKYTRDSWGWTDSKADAMQTCRQRREKWRAENGGAA